MIDLSLVLPEAAVDALVEAVTKRVLARLAEGGVEQGKTRAEWLTVRAAAEHMGVSEERVRKLISKEEIPYYSEGVGCRITLRRSELNAWLESFRHPARTER